MALYQHQWQDGSEITLPVGKVVCVGRNYAAHAKELNNPIPKEPLLFIKPASSLVRFEDMSVPQGLGQVHYEAEIAILIGSRLKSESLGQGVAEERCQQAIAGVGAALDLTLRDLQSQLKEKGQPWEKAKSFDGACPVAPFASPENFDVTNLPIRFWQGGELKQDGNSSDMLTPVLSLLSYITRYFTLEPGDIILTGTPEGVGKLSVGQSLKLGLSDSYSFSAQV